MAVQPPKNASEFASSVVSIARRDRYCPNESDQKTPLLAQDIAKMAIPVFGRAALCRDTLKTTAEYDTLIQHGEALLKRPEELFVKGSKTLIERSIRVLHAMKEERQVAALSHYLLLVGAILLIAGACISGSIAHGTFHNVTTSSNADVQFYIYGAATISMGVAGGAYALWQQFLPEQNEYASLQRLGKHLGEPAHNLAALPAEDSGTSAGCRDVEDRMTALANKYPKFSCNIV
jgi:hypothetical protein